MSARRTLDPTLDVVFKMLLTRAPESHDVLVALLTAVLRPKSPLGAITIRNPSLPGRDQLNDRSVVLDLFVTLEDGTTAMRPRWARTRRAAPSAPRNSATTAFGAWSIRA